MSSLSCVRGGDRERNRHCAQDRRRAIALQHHQFSDLWKGYAASYRGGRAGACAMSITSRQRLRALGMSLRLSLSFFISRDKLSMSRWWPSSPEGKVSGCFEGDLRLYECRPRPQRLRCCTRPRRCSPTHQQQWCLIHVRRLRPAPPPAPSCAILSPPLSLGSAQAAPSPLHKHHNKWRIAG